jgi:tetratricopeptide (TPR) repeat protein
MNGSEQRKTKGEKRTAIPFAVLLCSLFTLSCRGWAANEAYYNYLRGLLEERAGNPTKALDAYEKVVQEDPQALEAFRDIAELRLRMGQPDAALQAAQHAKDLAPADPTSFLFLGNVFVAQGDLAKAAEAYENALKLDPGNLRALENLGNYYAILDPDKAISYYQRYLESDPQDADIYFQMGLVYQKRGNIQKARALYQESLELDPSQLASHLAMADLYEEQKSTAAAIAEYEHSAQIQDSNPTILLRLGNLYYRDQKWDEAEKTFRQITTLAPQDPTAHYWLARIAEEKKNWKDAAAEATQAYSLSRDPQFLPLMAYYLTLDRQLAEAVKVLEKARESDPNNSNVLMFLGMDYLDLDQPEKAREALMKGVALYPKDAQMRFQLAMAEDRLGHFDDAVREFQDLLTVDPNNAAAMNYLGYSWADRGIRLEESEKLVRQAVAIEPANGAYLDSLGWIRYKRGDPREARNFLEKAVYYSPDPLIYEHLGDACLADQHPEAALQAWSKALSMDPKNVGVRKQIEETAGRLFSSNQAQKYSKYLEGNFKQVQSLRGHVVFEGGLNRHVLSAEGDLFYVQPDTVELHVSATKKMSALQFQIKAGQRQVEPAESNPVLTQLAFEGMASFSELLSGKMTDSLQTMMDPQTGVNARFSRPNPSGGKDEMTIVSYDFVEGLWLPSDIRVMNSTTGWRARLQFSEWSVNSDDHTK